MKTTQVEKAKTAPTSPPPKASKREILTSVSQTAGSLSRSTAALARKMDKGAGIVARRK